MLPLTLSDIQNILEYERSRPAFRARVIELKKDRRMTVGDVVTLVFENRDTVRFQIQEMARIERMVDDAAIQGELDAYNPLIPGDGELSATLLIDIADQARIKPTLDALVGLHKHLFIEVGSERIAATFDAGQFEEDRISAVQYVRFRLTPSARAAFANPAVPVRIVVDHPRYTHAVDMPTATRQSVMDDWDGEKRSA